MRTLITGGAGFIGSHIQDKLIELGHSVAIVDNLRSGTRDNLHENSTFYEVDIRDREKMISTFEHARPEVVFHLAAQNEVPYSMEHPDEDQEINIVGMMNLLEASRIHGVGKIIYSNTGGALYGDIPEEKLPITEDEPIVAPSSFYGVSKFAAEMYLRLYANLFGISYVSLRYANVYGPRQAGNREAGIVAIFTKKMLEGEIPTINGDGGHTRDYVFVHDVVNANIQAMQYDKNDYFNISTGVRTSNNDVYHALAASLGIQTPANYGPDRAGDTRHNALSPQKAKNLLSWSPQVSFTEGVSQTVSYYKNSK
ncbi:GDP-mannose 4,6-dehydratase [Candidatus Woesebacteria bacterium]|jgi:UDP-glucose 4-epimerase|nr:GDP-mannose 4,6-dehydratase [Candidatus Woesebacteria bacterium]MBP9687780.1 GDP-mannose 4,6-dehydratase [Candidatus Woesebacteria bacterium]